MTKGSPRPHQTDRPDRSARQVLAVVKRDRGPEKVPSAHTRGWIIRCPLDLGALRSDANRYDQTMTGDDEGGQLFRQAYRHADAFDNSPESNRSKGAIARLMAWAVAAFAEGFLRFELLVGAIFFSIVVTVIGATTDNPVWMSGYIAAGFIGIVLVAVALKRRWSFGRQWAVIVGVLVADWILMTVFWTIH